MSKENAEPLTKLLGLLFKAHPWHGVSIGGDAPEVVTAYIEIVPTDTVKYEMDKATGILAIDRPQRFSNVCPAPYGVGPPRHRRRRRPAGHLRAHRQRHLAQRHSIARGAHRRPQHDRRRRSRGG